MAVGWTVLAIPASELGVGPASCAWRAKPRLSHSWVMLWYCPFVSRYSTRSQPEISGQAVFNAAARFTQVASQPTHGTMLFLGGLIVGSMQWPFPSVGCGR